ncbi:uncharacterized protein [Typha latifolia]|uniref:uncharacterized protein n=1 Tax=Typha latifolia TaxID=4733 RepID=UPI003C2F1921
MPRHNVGITESFGGPHKIRKGGCPSSSSSSSVASSILKKNGVKRTILIRRRGGSSILVPMWKISVGSQSSSVGISKTFQNQKSYDFIGRMQSPISARKLATLLWKMSDVPSARMIEDLQEKKLKNEMRGRWRIARSRHPVSEILNLPRSSSLMRMMASDYKKSSYDEQNCRSSDLFSNASALEFQTCSRNLAPANSSKRNASRLKDLNNCLAASKGLLKAVLKISARGEMPSSAVSLVSALCTQLNKALVHVDQLIREQQSDISEVSCTMMQLSEENEAWKSREKEKISSVVHSILKELKAEEKMRRKAEKLNKKLGVELAQTTASLLEATEELQSERRSREIIEEICNELVRGVAEDKAHVEELRMVSANVQEQVEEEREMLQLANEWREERVQMKLSEAKVQFEENHAAIDQLRNELETFLTSKRKVFPLNESEDVACNSNVKNQKQLHPCKTTSASDLIASEFEKDEDQGQVEDDGFDSEDSDLHSIELNMDSSNKSYSWSYATAVDECKGKSIINEKKIVRSSTNYESMLRCECSSDGGTIEGIEQDFSITSQKLGGKLDEEKLYNKNNLLHNEAKKLDQNLERHEQVKELRGHFLAGSRHVLPQCLASPTRQSSRLHALQDKGD